MFNFLGRATNFELKSNRLLFEDILLYYDTNPMSIILLSQKSQFVRKITQ